MGGGKLRKERRRPSRGQCRMNSRKMASIEVLPAATLQELDLTSFIDSSIDQDSPALVVEVTETKKNALMGSGLEMPHLKFLGQVNKHLAAPHLDVAHIRPVPSQELPWCLGGAPGLETVVDVDGCQDCVRPELQMEATVHQHGSDQVVNPLNHALSMSSHLMNVRRSEVLDNLHWQQEVRELLGMKFRCIVRPDGLHIGLGNGLEMQQALVGKSRNLVSGSETHSPDTVGQDIHHGHVVLLLGSPQN